MIAVSAGPGPSVIREVRYTDETVILLCSDVGHTGPCPVPVPGLAAAVRDRAPGARVSVIANLCSGSGRLAAEMRARGAKRIVIGCRHGAARHDELLAQLRMGGVRRSGTCLVDLAPAGHPDPLRVTEQSAARILAAIARVSHADLDAPVRDRPVSLAGPVSRRNLFHPGSLNRRAVACWVDSRCGLRPPCQACVAACQHGAMQLTADGVLIDEAACTGCGACLSACRSDAITLSGWSISETEAAAAVLVAEARRLRAAAMVRGVAIVCTRAIASVPVGGDWLPLEVPSLEMATAGWPLQMLSAGVAVSILGCDDEACARRGRELDDLCAALADHAAAGWQRLTSEVTGWQPGTTNDSDRNGARRPVPPLGLREPAATTDALAALITRPVQPAIRTPGAKAAAPAFHQVDAVHGQQWRIESPAAPLGEITIDAAQCSACGNCTRACPTGALTATHPDEPTLMFSVNSAECTACGACVSSCPESAVWLQRVLDSANLVAGRRTIGQVVSTGRCDSCGRPLVAGLVRSVVALRLATSHPQIAARLRHEARCTDCLLAAPAVAGSHPGSQKTP